jgi:hypothetical protein
MIRIRDLRPFQLVLVAVLGASLPAGAIARGGGGHGGDSSMNPFTGDSYAYFHGGHNLGEQAMIIPWRTPVAKAADSGDRSVPNGTAKAPTTTTTNGRTAAFHSLDAPHGDQRTDTQQGGTP